LADKQFVFVDIQFFNEFNQSAGGGYQTLFFIGFNSTYSIVKLAGQPEFS
jgi:hypothetical protein